MPATSTSTDSESSVRQVALLGLIQGPAELLPISSSAHLTLVPWLFDWRYVELDPELRKSVEVALHAGAALALLIGQRQLVADELRGLDRRRLTVLTLSFTPAAIVGLGLERLIERRLGGPGATAIGLALGAAAMVAADRRGGALAAASGGEGQGERDHREADWGDGLALGVAQAAALAPGVSRNGATLAAARWRGFSREDANLLSRVIALPVIAGAALLKGLRLVKRGVGPEERRGLAAGVATSFLSTLASQRLIRMVERDRALWPYAVYRLALAAWVLVTRRRRLQDS